MWNDRGALTYLRVILGVQRCVQREQCPAGRQRALVFAFVGGPTELLRQGWKIPFAEEREQFVREAIEHTSTLRSGWLARRIEV